MTKSVYIMRGPPGSGKSTFSLKLKSGLEAQGLSVCIVSADDFHMKDGVYKFVASKLPDAHRECFSKFLDAMMTYDVVIVDNTNTRVWEFIDYVKVAKIAKAEIVIKEFKAKNIEEVKEWHARCVHGVPFDKVVQMSSRWEEFEPWETK